MVDVSFGFGRGPSECLLVGAVSECVLGWYAGELLVEDWDEGGTLMYLYAGSCYPINSLTGLPFIVLVCTVCDKLAAPS